MTPTETAAKHRIIDAVKWLAAHLAGAADDYHSLQTRIEQLHAARRELRAAKLPSRGHGLGPEAWGPADLLDALEEELDAVEVLG